MAFLVGCGFFDLGAFQVRQFLLTSYAAERALLCGRRGFLRRGGPDRHLQRQDVRRPGDGDALAVPPHADAARQRAALRHAAPGAAAVASATPATDGCRRWRLPAGTLERALFDVNRVGDVPRLRDPAPLLPVPAQRRPAAAGACARAQPPRSGLARRRHRARRAACAERARRPAATAPRRWRSAGSTSAPARRSLGVRTRAGAAEACYRRGAESRRCRGQGGSALPAWRSGTGGSGGSPRRQRSGASVLDADRTQQACGG